MAESVNNIRYRSVTPWMGLLIYTKSMSEDWITQFLLMGWLMNDKVEITRKEMVVTWLCVTALLLPGNPIWDSWCSARAFNRDPPDWIMNVVEWRNVLCFGSGFVRNVPKHFWRSDKNFYNSGRLERRVASYFDSN